MYLTGLGTAAPETSYSQKECWEFFHRSAHFKRMAPRSQALARKVLTGPNGIISRHLALESLEEAFAVGPDPLHERFRRTAPSLAARAATQALSGADLGSPDVDALLVSTCTGYLCPGLTSYVMEELGLRSDLLALDLVGQGCAAAIPNFQTAAALIASGHCRHVLSVCVEVCSAAFYLDDDPGVLISACLFGDGAGAALFSATPGSGRPRIRWHSSETAYSPADRDYLRFEQKNGMLRNILTRQVPGMAGKFAQTVLCSLLEKENMRKHQITNWLLHPGGREILAALRQSLDLAEQELQWSARVLEKRGNLSSASLYFVLQEALAGQAPAGWWYLTSFGAGFTCHGALIQVER
jgi:predicted naringenin-chalcone synthase